MSRVTDRRNPTSVEITDSQPLRVGVRWTRRSLLLVHRLLRPLMRFDWLKLGVWVGGLLFCLSFWVLLAIVCFGR